MTIDNVDQHLDGYVLAIAKDHALPPRLPKSLGQLVQIVLRYG